MSDRPPAGVLGSLPATRPHRRSDKRATKAPAAEKPTSAGRTSAPAEKPTAAPNPRVTGRRPAAAMRTSNARSETPPAKRPAAGRVRAPAATAPPPPPPEPSTAPEAAPGTLETVVQAAAELTEIGLKAGARALRGAVSRLPRP